MSTSSVDEENWGDGDLVTLALWNDAVNREFANLSTVPLNPSFPGGYTLAKRKETSERKTSVPDNRKEVSDLLHDDERALEALELCPIQVLQIMYCMAIQKDIPIVDMVNTPDIYKKLAQVDRDTIIEYFQKNGSFREIIQENILLAYHIFKSTIEIAEAE